jgi:hypothetical protein
MEAQVEWHGDQHTGKQHDENTEPHGPQWNLQVPPLSNFSNALVSQQQTPEAGWRLWQQLVVYPARRPWPFCPKHPVMYFSNVNTTIDTRGEPVVLQGVWRYAGTMKSLRQLLPPFTHAVVSYRDEVCNDTEWIWLLSKYTNFPARLPPLFSTARPTLCVAWLPCCTELLFLSVSRLSNSVSTSSIKNMDRRSHTPVSGVYKNCFEKC